MNPFFTFLGAKGVLRIYQELEETKEIFVVVSMPHQH
jgi:hypothetical protein